jgi:hypothetical protein
MTIISTTAMAQCLQTYDELIKNTFSPQIAVICSNDCETICLKNNLNFVELLQPFSRLNAEISVRDPSGYAYTVSNLKLSIKDTVTPPPQPTLAKKLLADVVSRTQPQLNAGIIVIVNGGRVPIVELLLKWYI